MLTAQIIFFAALGLLVILLVRRVRLNPRYMAKIGSLALSASRMLYGAGKNLGGTLFEQAKKASGFAATKSVFPRQDSGKNPFGASEIGFWQEDSVEEKPDLSSHLEEGDELFKAGKFDEAEKFFVKAAAAHPGDPKIYARLGVLYLNTKNYSDAIEALKVAVKLDKYNPGRHYNLALAYRGNKDKARSIASARETISLDPVTQKYRQLLEQLLESK